MKNKLHISLFIFLFSILSVDTQSNFYYYYKGQKVYLEVDKSTINLVTNENFTIGETSNVGLIPYTLQQDNDILTNKFGKVKYQTEPTLGDFYQKINLLKSKSNIKSIGLFFKRNGTTSIGTSNYFYVKLKSENDFRLLQQYTILKNVQIVKQVPNMSLWYILSTTNAQFSSLELSNEFYESGLFADIDPAFMFNFKNSCTNDPGFGSLWGLNNLSNPSIDINACQAWNLSQGLNVKVAVLDQGIHSTHNDLAGNISALSFNSQTGTSPSVFNGASHGTHVAGTIGAIKDNNLQVVGVAPQCKIIPVSHSLSLTPNLSAELASGISWAYQNGADIINNSWGDQGGQFYGQLYSTILENSILLAMSSGRNNKGTLIVFASGNFGVNSPIMDYPATFSNDIITVGSITNTGQRSIFNTSRGSGYGIKLDLVAPGSNIWSTIPNNSTDSNSGTSMAAPHVSGVCALILSANPCLTGQQVRDIIEQTSQKVGGYTYTIKAGRPNGTWNDQMGYGLVDAYAAVQMATRSNTEIFGNNAICISENYTTPSVATSYNWTIIEGASLVTIQGNGTANITLNTLPNASGQIILSLSTSGGICGNSTATKTIRVGTPSFPKFLSYPNIPYDSTLQNGPYWNPTWLFNTVDSNDMVTEFIFKDLNGNVLVSKSANNGTVEVSASELGMGPGSTLSFYVYPKNQCGEVVTIKKRVLQFTLYYPTLCQYGIGSGCHMQRMTSVSNTNVFSIYPNPSSEIVNIYLRNSEIPVNVFEILTGELFDIMGLSVLKIENKNSKANFSVAGLKKGIYMLKLYFNNESETHQIAVE